MRAGSQLWVAAAANLGIGLCAIIPELGIRWIVTQYLPMDCTSTDPPLHSTGCDRGTLEDGPIYMFYTALSGLLVLGIAVVVDVLMPLQERWRIDIWLPMALLVPVPFFAGLALDRF
ncbi:hypothetical protein ACFYPA_28860 [Streptomyces sp. NPDC005775]|uniref:hypothetical protein n=1 Tax=unclassified Streptomyces TaxID=2593676 RepID=UPI0033C32B72